MRVSTLALVAALIVVPAVGRARQRVDLPNAKPRLSAPYRSVDVRPVPVLIAPDTSAVACVNQDDGGHRFELTGVLTQPAVPDVSDRGSLRGPPLA
jgi:hypothetical protein